MLKILRRLLAQIGYTDVETATCVAEARSLLTARKFDLILSDWNMEGETGLDFLLEIRAKPDTADMPFVLVTAEAKKENVRAAEEAGASGYLIKPFTIEHLAATITAALSDARPSAA